MRPSLKDFVEFLTAHHPHAAIQLGADAGRAFPFRHDEAHLADVFAGSADAQKHFVTRICGEDDFQ